MHVVATAGHVDHGKSALVRSLTGIDPDRLEEEKRRGLTIDLGFAWLRLPSGREVGMVDVPGHERFIRNMLAGVGAVNAAIFVVAANEGWMPQSQEHLDILDLLGVDTAVVAVTKSDTVDEQRLAAVKEEVGRRIVGTALEGSEVLGVSVVTGKGMDELRIEIERLLDSAPPAPDHGRPRLWIDRVFTMKGAGTVVTGTLTGGGLGVGDEVEILPDGTRSRIRSIQSHNRRLEEVGPGSRTALNLVGVERTVLSRGEVASHPDTWRTTRRLGVRLRFLPHLSHEPGEKGAFKFHLGSFESDARLRFLGEPGERGVIAAVELREGTVADFGDRFVMRDAGRRLTVGGGVVLEPHLGDYRRGDEDLLEGLRRRELADRSAHLDILLQERGWLGHDEVRLLLGPSAGGDRGTSAIRTPGFLVSAAWLEEFSDRMASALSAHHRTRPREAGMARASARVEMEIPSRLFDELSELLVARGSLTADGEFLRLPGHSPDIGAEERRSLVDKLIAAGSSPPTVEDLQGEFDPDLIRALVRSGDLVQVSPELVYSPETIRGIQSALAAEIAQNGPVTVARFRDLVDTTRRFAVPLLEFLDSTGFTRRDGDRRVLGPRGSGAG